MMGQMTQSLFKKDDLTEKQAKIALAAFFLVLGFVGSIDAQDEQEAFERYNEMVCHGDVPDYKQTKPECV